MKPDQKVIVVIALLPILLGALAAFLLPRFINKPTPFISKAEIVRFASPQTNSADLTQEYHLWLKLEMSRLVFDNIFGSNNDASSEDAPMRKDEMRTERLANENPVKDVLVVKGYTGEGTTADTGSALRINKNVILSKENLKTLEDNESLSNPQVAPHNQFQPQTDIYCAEESDKVMLYIHLESGIKPRATRNQLSLTITYLKDNRSILSQTLPIFLY